MPLGGKLIVASSAIQLSAEDKPSYPELGPGRYVSACLRRCCREYSAVLHDKGTRQALA
jgi:hypothetical protein